MSKTPPPLAADIDLRDYRWMKLDVVRLLNSDFNAMADDTAWRCGVTLWMRAWHQVPAGSLPDDDATLCHLAGLGRDLKTWKHVRPLALRGFLPCDDGRLYHPVICGQAADAWAEKQVHNARRAADRKRKSAGKTADAAVPSGGIPPETGNVTTGNADDFQRKHPDIPPEKALRERGREEGKKEEGKPSSQERAAAETGRSSRLAADAALSAEGRAFALAEDHPDPDREWLTFADYWRALPGRKGVKADWEATWRNWVRKALDGARRGAPAVPANRGVTDLLLAEMADHGRC